MFLASLAGAWAGGALLLAQRDRSRWSDRLSLQVYTMRDRLTTDFEGAFAGIAEAG